MTNKKFDLKLYCTNCHWSGEMGQEAVKGPDSPISPVPQGYYCCPLCYNFVSMGKINQDVWEAELAAQPFFAYPVKSQSQIEFVNCMGCGKPVPKPLYGAKAACSVDCLSADSSPKH